MSFNLKNINSKSSASYKTIYLRDEVIEKIEKIAKERNTSFNSVITNMIDYCLEDLEKSDKENKKS